MKIYKLFITILVSLIFMVLPAFAENDGWGGPKSRVWRDRVMAPTVNDDEMHGFRTGDIWIDTTGGRVYVLLDEGSGSADWDLLNQSSSGVSNVPYGATWDGDQAHSPTMDGVYDKMETKQDTVTEGSLPNLITSSDVKDGELVNADISPTAEIDPNKLELKSGTTDVVSGETNAVEWHPNPYETATYRLTGTLSDPVVLLISETDTVGGSFSEGASFTIINAGVPVLAIGDIDGQQEVLPSGNTVYIPQNGRAKLVYTGSAWNVGVESTDRQTFDTINARVKTFSVSGIAGTYQFSSISGVTIDLTESEACGYGLIDSGASAWVLLPDADPGSGYVGELGQLLISIAGIDVTVTTEESGVTQVWVDGTATVVETGAVITTSTIGEYFTWAPAYVAQYGWRWMIRIKDD